MKLFLAIAIGPAILLLFYVYKKDRLEKEPAGLRLKLALLGALSVIPAVILEIFGTAAIPKDINIIQYYIIENFFVVALAEEGCKYFMLKKCTWKSPEFNCSYDGLLYAVYVSLGFAIVENVLYVLENGLGVGVMRALTAIPGHCFFGVFMGCRYSRAKREDYRGNKAASRTQLWLSVLFAAFVHGLYDYLLSVGTEAATMTFLVLLVVMYSLGLRAIKRESREDMYITPHTYSPVYGQYPHRPQRDRFDWGDNDR